MASMISYPSARGFCEGSYAIDKSVKEAVIVTGTEDNGILNGYANGRFCAWYINADAGNVIQLRFEYFFTECFWDTLTIFDGKDDTFPIIGRLCGNRDAEYGYSDVIISSGNHLTLHFQSDWDLTGRGFKAFSNQIAPVTVISEAFKPRMFHSSAYDSSLDIVYNTFGLRSGDFPENDMILYFPQNDSFVKRSGWSQSPSARYKHFSCVVDSKLIVFGGVSWSSEYNFGFEDILEIWSYDPISNAWSKLKSLGFAPPNLDDPAVVLAENSVSKIIYVFGGRYMSQSGRKNGVWSTLAKAPSQIFGASMIYHRETQTLHLIGGFISTYNPSFHNQYPSYTYSIQSNAWYTTTIRGKEHSMLYSSAQYIGNDLALIFGGMYVPTLPIVSPIEDCFSNILTIYDIACESFHYFPTDKLLKRAGHSMVIRNDTVYIFGGSDGIFRGSVVKLPLPVLNKTSAERDLCKADNFCKNFGDCSGCLSKSYCGWCPDHCVLNDMSLISIPNATSSTCPNQQPIQTSEFFCPIAIFAQLDRSYSNILNLATDYVDFAIYVDAPVNDLIAEVANINPAQATLNISLPYLNLSTFVLSGKIKGLLLPAEDLRRISGTYIFRVASNQNSIEFFPIQFSITFTLSSPTWLPPDRDFGWTSLDIISFSLVFAISLTLTIVMAMLIVRARRRLVSMQNWQNHTEYAEEITAYRPDLFSVIMRIPSPPHRRSQLNINLKNSQMSLESWKRSTEQLRWKNALPRLMRRLTKSQVDIDLNNPLSWPLSIEKMSLSQNLTGGKEIIGISYLVVNPGFERSVHSGNLPKLSVGTSLHNLDSSANRFPSFLSIGTLRNRTWRAYISNYFQNNSS